MQQPNEYLRKCRIDAGYKQRYVARYINITQQKYSLTENSRRKLKHPEAVKLSKLYTKPVSSFYTDGAAPAPLSLERENELLKMVVEAQKELIDELKKGK